MNAKQKHVTSPLPSGPIGKFLASMGNLSSCLGSVHTAFSQEHGLGPRGVWILSLISEGMGYPGEISRALKMPPSVISGDLNKLSDTGLVVGERSAEDGRRIRYFLTEKGCEMLAEAHALYVVILEDTLGTYDQPFLDTFLRTLFEISQKTRALVEEDGARVR